jgi:hypothetical protein
MVKRRGPPSEEWRTFLRNHAPDIAAMDLLVVPTMPSSSSGWTAETSSGSTSQQIRRQNGLPAKSEAFLWDEAPGYLIRDRDRIYGAIVTRRLRAMGIRDTSAAPASRWQNGVAERLIGSIRRECLDHFVVLGETHLRRVLQSYADYYNSVRAHRSLNKDAPVSRPVQRTDVISSRAILGGLHYHYARASVFGTHR